MTGILLLWASRGFLRWRSWGGAGRRALLLHGSTSSSATWWQVGPALAEAGWRVKAPDLLGHGASPRAGRALTPEVAAGWVARELADRPLDLVVGHSFGAAVALSLLARGPRSASWCWTSFRARAAWTGKPRRRRC